ncbi:hypothetical protein EC988_002517 [Linderina pennispora]|nr:hypothetical protein EC988_002517 [Linderina pennispora]
MSAFSARTYALPECHSVPRSKYEPAQSLKGSKKSHPARQVANPVFKNVLGFDHGSSLNTFVRLTATILRAELWNDRMLFERIFYRNWNQHKNSVYFRRVYELRRALRILDRVNIKSLVDTTMAAFFDAGTTKGQRKTSMWTALPCQHYMTALSGRVANVALLVAKIREICQNVYVQFAKQTAATLFMPLAMVMQGLVARMHMVLGVWHQDLCALYRELLIWLPCLPACPDSLSGRTEPLAKKLPGLESLVVKEKTTAKVQADMDKSAKEPVKSAASVKLSEDLGDLVVSKTKKGKKRSIMDLYDDDDLGGIVE